MATHLQWRPMSKDQRLGYELKFAIADKVWGHDGSLTSGWAEVGHDFIPFLEGVAAGAKGDTRGEAERLIGLIEMYGSVEISLRC